MILPPGLPGVAFTSAKEGDVRGSKSDRAAVAGLLGISGAWATADQVHGSGVVRASSAGSLGKRDGLFTTQVGVPVAVFTADCFGVALIADGAVGVAHAGWRGVVAGIVPSLREAMTGAGYPPAQAAIGPGIGPCCFEIGSEVAELLRGNESATTWGTKSVDLRQAIRSQLDGVDVWTADACTRCTSGFHSYRADSTQKRMATVTWID